MTVYLVGAGPGDPGLLTVRGAELLARADVVVHDRLVGPDVLAAAAPAARLVDVGKAAGSAPVPQSAINDLLVAEGRRADTVVRLKGGDPYVFGRGGEEAAALRAAGIACEVVPGVTSALAAPAAAGIPVTRRGLAGAVTVVAGHDDPSGSVAWDALAASGATLVVLMGAGRAGSVADRLLAGGLDPTTPVACVTWATTPRQRVRRTTLAGLGAVDLEPPTTIVIGAVAALDVGGP